MKFNNIRISKKSEDIIVKRLVKEVVKTGKAQTKQGILELILKEYDQFISEN